MLTIYHNPRCQKSRAALAYLINNQIEHTVFYYMKNNFALKQLNEILLKLNKKPSEIIRDQEEVFKKELKGRIFGEEEWKDIILSEPRLLIRPIVVAKHKAVIAIPPENIAKLL